MSIGGLIFAVVLFAVVLALVMIPLLRSSQLSVGAFERRQRQQALHYYERVLRNLRDLEEDHSTGKISTEEYESEREIWMERGVQVLQALNEGEGVPREAEPSMRRSAAELDAAVEEAIARASKRESAVTS
jgi:cytochrome c-type biogenesis protein CcmI